MEAKSAAETVKKTGPCMSHHCRGFRLVWCFETRNSLETLRTWHTPHAALPASLQPGDPLSSAASPMTLQCISRPFRIHSSLAARESGQFRRARLAVHGPRPNCCTWLCWRKQVNLAFLALHASAGNSWRRSVSSVLPSRRHRRAAAQISCSQGTTPAPASPLRTSISFTRCHGVLVMYGELVAVGFSGLDSGSRPHAEGWASHMFLTVAMM